MFILLFVITFAASLLLALILNPVHILLNIVQIVLGVLAVAFGITAYFQGLFDTAATGIFFITLVGWIVVAVIRSKPAPVDY